MKIVVRSLPLIALALFAACERKTSGVASPLVAESTSLPPARTPTITSEPLPALTANHDLNFIHYPPDFTPTGAFRRTQVNFRASRFGLDAIDSIRFEISFTNGGAVRVGLDRELIQKGAMSVNLVYPKSWIAQSCRLRWGNEERSLTCPTFQKRTISLSIQD